MPDLRASLDRFVRHVALAVQASTRLRPGAVAGAPDADSLRASLAHLPAAGWLVGAAACLAFALAALPLQGNPWAAAVAAVVATVVALLLTGARNEAGLLRAFDAAGSGAGTGLVVLVLVLVARIVLLAALAAAAETAVIAALFAAHVVSRLSPLAVAHGLAADGGGFATLRVAALWCVVPLLLMMPAGGVACALLALVAAAVACWAMLAFCRRTAGAAADQAAAVQQVSELAFLFGAALGA
ncbi:MAG TPA: adenosylcobinamide-GDP ribazoletransferase [Ramlibacter sp.]|jgi:adenosylcobinamide-GDP ribazoletransferase|nr:adenosylcobinamide-GDP ribazoletransferase [Ramlibacter sp.]